MMSRWLLLGLLWLGCDDAEPASEAEGQRETTESDDTLGWLRVQEPGDEPRRRPRVHFEPGREERATLTFDSLFEPAGAERARERLELELAVRYPTAQRVLLEVREARTTAGDIPAIETTLGTTAAMTFHPTGAAEQEPELVLAPGAHPRAAAYVRGALVQVLPALVPAFPGEPVGEGARWGGQGLDFTLVEDAGDALHVERRTGLEREEVLPDGRRIDASEEQVYRILARLDRVARSIEAELRTRGSEGTRRRTELRFEVRP